MNGSLDSQPRSAVSSQAPKWHKRLMLKVIPLILLLATGCGGPIAADNGNEAADPPPPAAAGKPVAQPVNIHEKTELLDFHLAWPAEVSAIPPLAAKIRSAATAHKAELLKNAGEDKAWRSKQGFPFQSYEYGDEFSVEGNAPRLLSLGEQWFEYTGGAHPMHGTRALLWDRLAGHEMSFADLFTGGAAMIERLFKPSYCAALDKARAEKRGPAEAGEVSGPDDPFTQCPKFADLVLIPTGEPGQPMSRVIVHADPYIAGPYSEGDYDVALPLTADVIAALKAEYRPSFEAQRPQ